jgi:hypothetical protein
MSQISTLNRFRPGRNGACEALLWKFVSFNIDGEEKPPAIWIAACSIDEAFAYVREFYPDFRIRVIKLIRIIQMISGSPLN